jgi:adenylyltransferase/sulfurtransferase
MAQVVIAGCGALAEAVAEALSSVAKVVRVDALQAGATFELLLDADLLIDVTGERDDLLLANDAAAVRGVPMVWAAAGEAGVAWDERGADYRDWPDGAAGTPDVALTPVVTGLAREALTGGAVPRAIVDGVAWPLERRGPRPGSLEERTALREPDPARSVSAEQLAKLLAGPTTGGVHETPPLLLDVRERPEASFASLPGAVLIPLGELPARLDELPREEPIVVYCHHGVRSARALELLEQAGFTRARHLTGGIDAWSVTVDPSVPRYGG